MRRSFCIWCGLAAALLLIGTHAASAAIIAQYDFEDFTTDNATWPANNGPYADSASSSDATVSPLSSVGLSSLEALAVRDASHGDLDSHALLIGAGSIPGAVSDSADYFGFTVAADATLLLNSFSFDFGASNVDDNDTLGHEADAQLYYSTDGGVTFNAIGALQERDTLPGPDDIFTGMLTSNIDLSGLAPLPAGDSIEFRLAMANNRGYGSTAGAVYLDNLVLDATAVPEPSTIALIGLSALGLLALRRR